MRRVSFIALAGLLCASASGLHAQEPVLGPCATPDSLAFAGNTRQTAEYLTQEVGFVRRKLLGAPGLKLIENTLFATGQYDDFRVECQPAATSPTGKTVILITVKERPVLHSVDVTGVEHVSSSAVRDRITLEVGRPADPGQIAYAISKIDSVYMNAGYYLARVRVDSTITEGELGLTFRVDEGHRLAISGILVQGNHAISSGEIVGAMATKPEGFFWWRTGEFDDDKWAADQVQAIPQLYAQRGFIDMQIVHDSVIVNRELGKAYLLLTVKEGPQYRVGSFEVTGSKHFAADELARFYPFTSQARGLSDVVKGALGAKKSPTTIFDRDAWDQATGKVKDAYENEGYIYSRVDPVVERELVGKDSVPTVNLRWEINEATPAIINRINITGNDFTSEACIRDQLFILPGDVFNKDRLIRSYSNIGNLGFFESPIDEPKTEAANDKGDIDLTFHVKEKKNNTFNFGASVGEGTGLGGFIGFTTPNLFGQCKSGSVNWQFGQYVNDFSTSYTDPRIRNSRVSGTVTAYHSQSKFIIDSIGQSTRTGAQIRVGFPLAGSRSGTRLYVDYGGEKVSYGNSGLVATIPCTSCFRSTLGTSLEYDTRIGLPFPVGGMKQAIGAEFNGGPLGGTASFAKYTTETRTAATLARIGPQGPGHDPMLLTFNLSARAGVLFGDPGPFFVSQSFSMGGTQYGEPLRGYEEFSITPQGFAVNASEQEAQRASFGNAFYAETAELGLRINSSLNLTMFYDAGNLWNRPRDFDPTRLFRGAGFGGLIVTPLGPLGVDLGYGFDRLDAFGRKAPKWQVHFKFGQVL